MQQTTEAKICEQDKRLYSVLTWRVQAKFVSLAHAISILQTEVVDTEYFNSVGKDQFIQAVKK